MMYEVEENIIILGNKYDLKVMFMTDSRRNKHLILRSSREARSGDNNFVIEVSNSIYNLLKKFIVQTNNGS